MVQRLFLSPGWIDSVCLHLRIAGSLCQENGLSYLRLRTDAAKRYKKIENATTVIWKMLLLAEQRFRRLDAQEKLTQVYLGIGPDFITEATTKQEEVLTVT